jgi:membrane-associated phospholipid phosphatase
VSSLQLQRPRLAAAGALLLAATIVLVVSGAVSFADRFAVTHLMPWLRPHNHAAVTVSSITVPSLHGPIGQVLLGLWTYPAAFVPSLVIVVLSARRLDRADGVTLCGLWLAGNLAEGLGKLTITRPELFKHHVHVASFDNSLPSGHTIRSLVVAAGLTLAWRRGVAAYLWAAGVLVALVVSGAHTPTDVLAGLFVGMLLAGWAPPRFAYLEWGRTRMGGERGTVGRAP